MAGEELEESGVVLHHPPIGRCVVWSDPTWVFSLSGSVRAFPNLASFATVTARKTRSPSSQA